MESKAKLIETNVSKVDKEEAADCKTKPVTGERDVYIPTFIKQCNTLEQIKKHLL